MDTCFIHFRDTNVALREVLLKDSRRKLQLIYEGDTLTDCVDESLRKEDDNDCSMDLRSEDRSSGEAKIEIFGGEGGSDPAAPELGWLAGTRELRNRCSDVKTRARNQLIAQHRHRWEATFRSTAHRE